MAVVNGSAQDIFHPDLVRTNSYSNAIQTGSTLTLDEINQALKDDGIYVALLNRSPGVPFGFALGTTVDNEHLIHVSNRFSERKTIASRRASGATAFRDGDVLLSVNGRSVHRMSHDQVMTLMKDETVLSLEIRRHHPDYRVVDIIRMSVDEPIGIQLASSGETSVFILKVLPDGPCDGKLEEHDVIIACNGRLLDTMSHDDAVKYIGSRKTFKFTIERHAGKAENIKTSLKRSTSRRGAVAMVDITLRRASYTEGWGIGLGDTIDGRQVISKVAEARDADGLFVLDEIVAVNGRSAEHMTHDQLVHQMQSSLEVALKLKRNASLIMDPQRRRRASLADDQVKFAKREDELPSTTMMVTIKRPNAESPFGFGVGTLESGSGHVVEKVTPNSLAEGILEQWDKLIMVNGVDVTHMPHQEVLAQFKGVVVLNLMIDRGAETSQQHGAVAEADGSAARALAAELEGERVPLVIAKKHDGESIGIQLGTDERGLNMITGVNAGSPADGVLQFWDILVEIDGINVLGITHDECLAQIVGKSKFDCVVVRDESKPMSETVQVTVSRPSMQEGYGFGVGTTEYGDHVISSVTPPVFDKYEIRVADVITAINGTDTTSLLHEDVIALMVAGLVVELTLTRKIDAAQPVKLRSRGSISTLAPNVQVPVRVSNIGEHHTKETHVLKLKRDSEKTGYGFGVGTTGDGDMLITEASAELIEDGQMFVGDRLKRVNGVKIDGKEHDEVVNMICVGTAVTLHLERVVLDEDEDRQYGSITEVEPDTTIASRTEQLGTSHEST